MCSSHSWYIDASGTWKPLSHWNRNTIITILITWHCIFCDDNIYINFIYLQHYCALTFIDFIYQTTYRECLGLHNSYPDFWMLIYTGSGIKPTGNCELHGKPINILFWYIYKNNFVLSLLKFEKFAIERLIKNELFIYISSRL